MIQRTFDIVNEAEFAWMVSSLKDPRLFNDTHRVLVQLYFSRFAASEAQNVLDYLHAELPQVNIVGMSLYGDALVQLNTTKMLRANICDFAESEITVFEYDAETLGEEEICSRFRKELSSIKNAKGVLVLARQNPPSFQA